MERCQQSRRASRSKNAEAFLKVRTELECDMAIPKIIHYCWFGRNEIPQREKECINTWKKFFPDYKIICWNEENCDLCSCDYVKEAYENNSFAFVSDYVRAKVLYEHGGIYLDTDVKILKRFQQNCSNGFMGFERKKFLGTAVMACEPENKVIGSLLSYYQKNHFIQKNGYEDKIANVSVLTDIMIEKGLILNGKKQNISGFDIFEREIFYPKKISEDEFLITKSTCAIHMCTNSWMTDREKKRGNNKIWIEVIRPLLRVLRRILIKLLGNDRVRAIENCFRNKLK